MRLIRIILFFATVLMIGVAAVAVKPEHHEDLRSMDLVFESFSGPAGFSLPDEWEAVDPFATSTPYYGLLWYHQIPQPNDRVALVKHREDPAELLLMVASRGSIEATLAREKERFRGHPQVEVSPDHVIRTATGERVSLRIARVKNPVHADGDTTYLIGSAPVGEDLMFVVNGGALSDVFDISEIEEIIENLRIPSRPL